MKKKLILVSVILPVVFLLAGCSQLGSSGDTSSGTINTVGAEIPQEPGDKADISGIIKSITANEVVVAVIDMPEMGSENGTPKAENANEEENTKSAAALSFNSTGATGGPMGGPSGEGPRGDREEMDENSILEEILSKSKESITVTVPVGIQMIKQNGAQSDEATFSDLETGSMVSVWLNDSVTGRNVAEFVSLR